MSNWHPHIIIIGSICVGYNHFCKRRNNLKRIVQQLHHKFVMICCLELSITPRRGNYWKTHIFCMIIFVASVKRMEENVSNFMTDHEKKFRFVFITRDQGQREMNLRRHIDWSINYTKRRFLIGIPKYRVDNCPFTGNNKCLHTHYVTCK